MSNKTFKELLEKFEHDRGVVGVLGLGYVGLPLAVAFAKKGIKVVGFEKSSHKSDQVNAGHNYIGDVVDSELKAAVKSHTLVATTDFSRLKECDAVIICVPTPLDKFKKPEMSYIASAGKDIGAYMKKGVFISLESTTYPTTTEEYLLPIIAQESGLNVNEDFWLCYSAERVDPGNHSFKTENTPKVVGGFGEEAQKLAMTLYSKAIPVLHPVSSPRVAEMTKILENTYRLINISLVNELALLSGKMDISIWEVIEAAKTKPYGFQAFYPGPGIGGHCIPLDPFYLEYIAKNYQFDLTMINTAGQIDNLMPHRMTIKITSALNRHKKSVNGSKILFLGVAYKGDIDDPRESPALKIIDEVIKKGGDVVVHDPYISTFKTEEHGEMHSVPLTDDLLKSTDCVVVTTKHTNVDYQRVYEFSKLIVDLRNAFEQNDEKVYKL